jgi:hypothetical protein
MTIAIHLEEQTVRQLRERATARGLSLEQYLDELARLAPNGHASQASDAKDAVKEYDAALDELFSADTRKMHTGTSTYSREDIYFDHD